MASTHPDLGIDLARFREPPWRAALDVPRALSLINADSSIAGMFFLGVLEAAKRRGVALPERATAIYRSDSILSPSLRHCWLPRLGCFTPKLSLREGYARSSRAASAVSPKPCCGKVTHKP